MKLTKLMPTVFAILAGAGIFGEEAVILRIRADQPPVDSTNSEKRAFLVREMAWLAYLDVNGRLVEEFQNYSQGATSPDGKWLAATRKAEQDLIIRPIAGSDKPIKLEFTLAVPYPYVELKWSRDSKRLLIWETGSTDQKEFQFATRIFDMQSQKFSTLKLPVQCDVNDWSADGSRILTDMLADDVGNDGRWRGIAWLNVDGSGAPEFLTGKDETATEGRLSPDGKKLLFLTEKRPTLADHGHGA